MRPRSYEGTEQLRNLFANSYASLYYILIVSENKYNLQEDYHDNKNGIVADPASGLYEQMDILVKMENSKNST